MIQVTAAVRNRLVPRSIFYAFNDATLEGHIEKTIHCKIKRIQNEHMCELYCASISLFCQKLQSYQKDFKKCILFKNVLTLMLSNQAMVPRTKTIKTLEMLRS